ncbi:MAG: ATP-binding protein [Planctomycetes bacterium]|nr:ATP-binding protein [Planctomycetota bacterium]
MPSDDALVTPLVVRLTEFMVKEGLIVDKERNRIGLCIEEACRNAVHHGNRRDFKKPVRIKIYLNDLNWSIRVDDEGKGFDLSKVPSPVSEHGMWGERGRGLSLIALSMDKVVYYRNGSTLVMSKEL